MNIRSFGHTLSKGNKVLAVARGLIATFDSIDCSLDYSEMLWRTSTRKSSRWLTSSPTEAVPWCLSEVNVNTAFSTEIGIDTREIGEENWLCLRET
jgi:hypothetical protein